MKKNLPVLLVAVLMLFPISASAQTYTDTQRAELIKTLQNLVLILTQQIAQILEQQRQMLSQQQTVLDRLAPAIPNATIPSMEVTEETHVVKRDLEIYQSPEVSRPQESRNGYFRAALYVLVKDDGKEVEGVPVVFHNPDTGVDETSITYNVGRAIPDSKGDTRFSQMHTGARFVYDPVNPTPDTVQILRFSVGEIEKSIEIPIGQKVLVQL